MEELSLVKPAKIRLLVRVVVADDALCVTEGIKKLRQIRTRMTKEGKQTRYESIFRKGYAWLSLRAQRMELFLDFLLTSLGKAISEAYLKANCPVIAQQRLTVGEPGKHC